MPISTRSSKEELLFFSDPAHLERSIRKEKLAASIDTTYTSSIDTCERESIDTSSATSVDTNLRATMSEILVLQRDENGDLHDQDGHLRNAAGQRTDAQGTVIPNSDIDATGAAIPVDENAR